MRTHNIVFGVTNNRILDGRYAICKEIRPSQWNPNILVANTLYNLNYKNADFALKKAESFVKKCYRDFIDFTGEQVKFTFENRGIVKIG